jgi:SAM-dependent methyltransferase
MIMTTKQPGKIVERRNFSAIVRIFFRFLLNDTVNAFILLLKKNRKYRFDETKFKGINLGSSTDNPPGWMGISGGITIFFVNLPSLFLRMAYPFSKRSKKQSFSEFHRKIKNGKVIHHNLFYGLPFDNNSVPNIFSSHFMEHLTYDSAKFVLQESYRVLKPGGLLRILVPSLDTEVERMKEAITSYQQGDIAPVQKFMSEPYEELHDPFSHHRYMYNIPALMKICNEAGFNIVKEMQPGEGRFPDLTLLEKRKSIIIEAVKEK